MIESLQLGRSTLCASWDRCSFRSREIARAVTAVATTARAVDELARHRRFGHALARNRRDAVHFSGDHARHGTPAFHFHFDSQLVAGAYGTPELRPLDAGKHHHFVRT